MPYTYFKSGRRYKKLDRNEEILPGAMQSWDNGELQPITNSNGETFGATPIEFSNERDFYNPIPMFHFSCAKSIEPQTTIEHGDHVYLNVTAIHYGAFVQVVMTCSACGFVEDITSTIIVKQQPKSAIDDLLKP